MLDRTELSTLAKSIARATRDHLASAVSALTTRFEAEVQKIAERVNAVEDHIDKMAPAPRGEKGDRGESGAPGKDGERGPAGERGEKGDHGERGEPGSAGKDGRDGRDGKDGRDGDAGRDAAELHILSSIDKTRSYPPRTYASYRGGILRSIRHTDPIAETVELSGWEVLVEGLAAVEIEQKADLREFSIECSLTSGKRVSRQIYLPIPVYKHAFREGKAYKAGDIVTWSGSLWHCNGETTDKPQEGKLWTLCVKEGRPGKDGKNGERGADGPRGKDGRDYAPPAFDGRHP
jgi:Collagen triple helix repeat (20 copies)/Carbohydrate-binding module family 5/12